MPLNSLDSGPASYAFSITPSDSVDLADLENSPRGIYVGGAGNLTVVLLDNSSSITFIGVVAGVVYPLKVRKVMATGTTATNLIGLK